MQYIVIAVSSSNHITIEEKRSGSLQTLKHYVKGLVHISNYDNNKFAVYIIDRNRKIYLDKKFNETTEKVSHSKYDYQADEIFTWYSSCFKITCCR